MPELTTTLYTAPGCGGCIATAAALDRAGIVHHTVNTAEDTAAADYLRSLGVLSAPAVMVTDQAGVVVMHWTHYRLDKITALAARLPGRPAGDDRAA